VLSIRLTRLQCHSTNNISDRGIKVPVIAQCQQGEWSAAVEPEAFEVQKV
jgi:hypothetical protein